MSPEKARELWSNFLSGEPLSEEEEAQLLSALDADPALRDEILDDAQLEGSLRALGWGRGEEKPFARAFLDCLEAKRAETGFVRKFRTRLEVKADSRVRGRSAHSGRRWFRPSGENPGGRFLVLALVAAGILVGLTLLFSLSPSAPSRQGPRKLESVREEAVREETVPEEGPRKEERTRARREAEARLEKLRDEERRADAARRETTMDDLKQKADEAFREIAEKRKAEEKGLAKLKDEERKIEKAPPTPIPQDKPVTAAGVAKLERVRAEVYVVAPSGRTPAKEGDELRAGQGLETVGTRSLAIVTYPDKTRVEVEDDAEVREVTVEGGKRLFVARGIVRAEVARQPKGEPMVFATPHGDATVLGTTLRIVVDPDPKKGTRLEVESGKVEFRNLAGKAVAVESGHVAVGATGIDLVARPLRIEEILLLPRHGKIIGSDWKLVPDENTGSGEALEAEEIRTLDVTEARSKSGRLGHVEYTFYADANRDYHVWVRGRNVPKGNLNPDDMVLLRIYDAIMIRAFNAVWSEEEKGPNHMTSFNGFANRKPYWWVGGNADPEPNGRVPDEVPVRIRFLKSGPQKFHVFGVETPMRIDTIWLSTTQKTRPDSNARGPEGLRR